MNLKTSETIKNWQIAKITAREHLPLLQYHTPGGHGLAGMLLALLLLHVSLRFSSDHVTFDLIHLPVRPTKL